MIGLLVVFLAFAFAGQGLTECVNDPDFGPFLVEASGFRIITLQNAQNITLLKTEGVDSIFSLPSNFSLSIDDSRGRRYTGKSVQGCIDANSTIYDLQPVVQLRVNCTNAFFDCVISIEVDYDICFPVCRGEGCQDNGCGGKCVGCYVPCEGDYCLITPPPESASPIPVNPTASNSPLNSESKSGEARQTLNSAETAGVVIAVIGAFIFAGGVFVYRRRGLLLKK
jgi:hypothetical protein